MGLFEQIEKRKNVHVYNPGPLTEDEKKVFMKRMNELNWTPASDTVITNSAIVDQLTKLAAEDHQSKVLEKLITILSTLYIENTITAKRYTELEQLLLSTDSESQVLGAKIVQSLYKKEIVI